MGISEPEPQALPEFQATFEISKKPPE